MTVAFRTCCHSPSCWAKNKYGCKEAGKLKKPTKHASLAGGNYVALQNALGSKQGLDAYHPLLQLIAETLDNIASGEDVFLTFGATKRRDAYLLTLTWDREPTYLPGSSLEDLSVGAQNFL